MDIDEKPTAAERPSRVARGVIEIASVSDAGAALLLVFRPAAPFISILVWSVMLAVALYPVLTGCRASRHRPAPERRSPR